MRDVELIAVTEHDKAVLANLLQLYCYEMSAVRGYDLTEHGTYNYRYLDHYFIEAERHAFLVRDGGALAGFVMSRVLPTGEREVAEFFVVRSHRRAEVGTRAAQALFDMYPGRWAVAYDDLNADGSAFWPVVAQNLAAGGVQREQLGPPDHRYEQTLLRFTSG